ncbi:MAG: hypothetical protein AAGA75_00545 [Cyanobacteria bacterium P01_E01_bin.6]
MTQQTLGAALTAYRAALKSEISEPQHVLEILSARDRLHTALKDVPTPGNYLLTEIHSLDQVLNNKATALISTLDFSTYRKSFPKSSEQWWWFLDESLKPKYEWAWKGFITLLWAINLGFLVNISGRFLLGGAGVAGLSAVALTNLLTLLKARNDVTNAGREGIQFLFDRFKIEKNQQLQAKFGTTALLTGGLCTFWLALPWISNIYNQRGLTAQQTGKLGSAEQRYTLAISLNVDNVDAHYNLGTLYEDIQELDKAETHYAIAIRGDLPEAYNNLARLYLQSSEPELNKALALLNQGLKLADEQQSYPEIKYSLYKNLGWALYQQAEQDSSPSAFNAAQSALDTAIAISEQPEAESYVNNPGSAHCLLAQTLEAQGQTDTLLVWQRCCQLGDRSIPEENGWLTLARQRFESENLDYNEVCRSTATPL